jgi:photosystem II stability/assembly factor-like uncharacterized protein
MMRRALILRWSCLVLAALLCSRGAVAQPFDPSLFSELRWRCIGPFRGGRTVGATGVPGQPNVFYIGVNNGGVWKSTDYGRVWTPIFDREETGSIGALAVAPSNPDVIYVGSGEGLHRPDLSVGDGVYRSADAGRTWKHVGLSDAQQIGAILVDPKDPNRVFVAVLGHPYGPNAERGVFRSSDGGARWEKVLYKDDNTGAIALAFDPSDPRTIYADLWSAREGPWENGSWSGPGSGLYKSTDGGTTWRQLAKGLPTFEQGLGRIGFAVAPSDPKRLYAIVEAQAKFGGVFRSDDAGESWRRVNTESRVWGRASDFAEIKVNPRNPDVVWSANTSTYRSTDGGKTFTAVKGAPGGDDYHTVWLNPDNPQIVLLASDQGATISVNGGKTWSSWYNQPTAQFYHVSTDNRFPYWVYGGQQESGSAAVASRGDYGAITFRDFHPVGAEEYGYVAADPLDPDVVYGGKLTRFDRRTLEVQNVSPAPIRSGKYRFIRTAPVLFSPVDPHVLFYAGQVLFRTTNGGMSWDVISPDLSREHPDVPDSIGVFRTEEMKTMARRGVIYTVAPSYKDVNVIWAGTDDGLVHVTRDGGKTWTDVTPQGLTAWSKVSLIDAGRFDADTAYAAVNRFRLDDQKPHVYRTHDGGRTWKEIVKGLPDGPVNVVREDPVRRGLLYAGTERAVFVSFDDGETWQSLRGNMPATSVRDLVIHGDDLVVGTHGRSFWILDDVTPLRQLTLEVARSDVFLFQPETAYRVRRSKYTDTPLPPEEPAGENPPDGAILDYLLGPGIRGSVALEILDGKGGLVRRFTSEDKSDALPEIEMNVPTYWVRSFRALSAGAGLHRFVWDLRTEPPPAVSRDYPISAVPADTPLEPLGVAVVPGPYTVRLTAGGRTLTQPLVVAMDPRVKTSPGGLAQQHDLSMQLVEAMKRDRAALDQVKAVRARLQAAAERSKGTDLGKRAADLDGRVAAFEGTASRFSRRGGGGDNFAGVNGDLQGLYEVLQGADAAPTTQTVGACADTQSRLDKLLAAWKDLRDRELPPLDEEIRKAGREP